MTESLPDPLVPIDVDLRNFAYTPMFRGRLFGSSFHAKVSDAGWRAGVTLWLKSWDQTPAGTLPEDEVELCRLAELARDLKSWRKVAKEALWGWFKCSDGRLHHRTVADGVLEAWGQKQTQRDRTAKARATRLSQRQSQPGETNTTEDATEPVTTSVTETVTSSNRTEGKGIEEEAAAQLSRAAREKRLEPHDDGPNRFNEVMAACVEALGDKSPADAVIGPIMLLLDSGITLRQVTTILRSEANRPRRKPIGRWSVWAEIIAEKLAAAPKIAVQPAKPVDPNDPLIHLTDEVAWPESLVRRVVEQFEVYPDSWPDGVGPAPNKPGCRIPQHLLPVQHEELRH